MAEPAVPRLSGRQTEQRRALLSFLASADRCLSAQEIHVQMRRDGARVSLATIYRTLALLTEAGALDVVLRADGEATYVLGSERHHHHLVCRHCGRAEEIAEPSVLRWADDVAEQHGFTEVTHALTVFGVCAACRTADAAPAGPGAGPS